MCDNSGTADTVKHHIFFKIGIKQMNLNMRKTFPDCSLTSLSIPLHALKSITCARNALICFQMPLPCHCEDAELA